MNLLLDKYPDIAGSLSFNMLLFTYRGILEGSLTRNIKLLLNS